MVIGTLLVTDHTRMRAGTPNLLSEEGLGWYRLEDGASLVDEVHHRISLLFRNRKEETWLAAARGAFDLCRLVKPLPEVTRQFIHLHLL